MSTKKALININLITKNKGFTLIELLVVIAIIAILVVIVIVAINPIQRLADASDRQASANVRATGTLVHTCIFQQIVGKTTSNVYTSAAYSAGPPLQGGCAVVTGSTTSAIFQYGTPAANVLVETSTASTDICVSQQGATNGATPHWYGYRAATTGTPSGFTTEPAGVVVQQTGTMPTNQTGRCP